MPIKRSSNRKLKEKEDKILLIGNGVDARKFQRRLREIMMRNDWVGLRSRELKKLGMTKDEWKAAFRFPFNEDDKETLAALQKLADQRGKLTVILEIKSNELYNLSEKSLIPRWRW